MSENEAREHCKHNPETYCQFCLTALRKNLEKIESRIDSLNEALAKREIESEALRAVIEDLTSQLAEREREIKELRAVQHFCSKPEECPGGCANLLEAGRKIAALTKEVERLNYFVGSLHNYDGDAKRLLEETVSENAALTQKLKDAEAEISRLNGMVTSQLMANSGFKKRAEEAEATLGKMREALEKIAKHENHERICYSLQACCGGDQECAQKALAALSQSEGTGGKL